MTVERIVRPFQTGPVAPSKPFQSSQEASSESNAKLEIGKNGSCKVMGWSISTQTSYYMDQKFQEKTQMVEE